MLITEVQKQKKHLTKLVLEGGEEVLLDNDICFNYSLKPERQITEEELSKLRAPIKPALWERGDVADKA